MDGNLMLDPCASQACLVSPAEFVRLRYFFGQRLNVVDLADEQSYFAGKQRFHNARAHGTGVLCGLTADRYVFSQGSPANTPTTLLRVHRGAALDACGREIIVGWDQCIDVASWYAQHPDAHPAAPASASPLSGASASGSPTANTPAARSPTSITPPGIAGPAAAPPAPGSAPVSGTPPAGLRLWVALCYRECPSDPAPAPRDPCGCDAGGCEFARIREGFELKLLTDAEAKLVAPKPGIPGAGGMAETVLGGSLDNAVARLVAQIAGAPCPDAAGDPCLLLASFQATLDATTGRLTDLSAPNNLIPERLSILSTAVLQQALIQTFAAVAGAELLGSGPQLQTVTFTNPGADSGTLAVALGPDAATLSRDPFAAPAQLTVKVSRFLDDGTWEAVDPGTSTYVTAPAPHLELAWPSGLVDGGRYRVLIDSDRSQPPVDGQMRPLTPATWARHFRLQKGSDGNLALSASLY